MKFLVTPLNDSDNTLPAPEVQFRKGTSGGAVAVVITLSNPKREISIRSEDWENLQFLCSGKKGNGT